MVAHDKNSTGLPLPADAATTSRTAAMCASVWHWDFQTAVAAAVVAAVAVAATSTVPRWWWAAATAAVSAPLWLIAAGEIATVRTWLRDSRYGQFIRCVDPDAVKCRMPYAITLWVSAGGCFGGVGAAMLFAVSGSRFVDVVAAGGVVLLTVWSALCVVSVRGLDVLHARLSAEVDAMPEVVDDFIAQHTRPGL